MPSKPTAFNPDPAHDDLLSRSGIRSLALGKEETLHILPPLFLCLALKATPAATETKEDKLKITPVIALLLATSACETGLLDEEDIGHSEFAITTNKFTPGSMKYYVVSVAKLPITDPPIEESSDVVKLAQVTFLSSLDGHYYGAMAGRVSWSGWAWRRGATAGQPDHAGTFGSGGTGATVGAGCAQTGVIRHSPNGELFNTGTNAQPAAVGELRVAPSFNGAATETKSGDYYVVTSSTPNFVHIRWDDSSWEDWDIGAAASGLQQLNWRNSNVGYNQGIAAGSDADFSTRVHPSNIAGLPGGAYGLNLSTMTSCSSPTWVANQSGYVDAVSPCSCVPKRSYINNWLQKISSYDRRDSWHSWCQCLAWSNPWYSQGSHQQMLLQAIDTDGGFRGWVGARVDNNFDHTSRLLPLLLRL